MKATPQEGQVFSDSIDQINNGIEAIINLYNDLESDRPFIKFDPDVIERIGKVKEKYGDDFVDRKINTVVREMIEWLPIDDVTSETETPEDTGPKRGKRKKANSGDETSENDVSEDTPPNDESTASDT